MTDTYTYIRCQSISPIDKLITCQDAGKEHFSYIIWKTRSLFLLFGTIIISKLEADVLSTKSKFYYVQRILLLALIAFE